MVGDLVSRKELLSRIESVLPVGTNEQYHQALLLITQSRDILELKDSPMLVEAICDLHDYVDSYISNLPQAIELEKMCEHYEQSMHSNVA